MRSVLSSCCPALSVIEREWVELSNPSIFWSYLIFFLVAVALGGTEIRHKKLTGHLGCRPDREQEPAGPVRATGDWKLAGKSFPGGGGSPGAGCGTAPCLSFPAGRKGRVAQGMLC